MEQLELRMTTDLATAIPAEIGFNFDELKSELSARLEHYNHLVVTEDTIQAGKEDRANLRKLRDAIETRRKEVKKQCEQPYKAFEARVKELTALIDAPIMAIDSQVKAFEEQQRQQKYAEIEAVYDEKVPEALREIIPLRRVMDPAWLNKGTSMKKVTEAIETLVKRTRVDMVIIDGVDPKYMTAVQQKYIETLDVQAALNERDKLVAAEMAFQQREAERTVYQPPAEKTPPAAVSEPSRGPAHTPAPQPHERLYPLRLEFKLTRGQADALKQFLQANNIAYTNITNI